MSLVEHKLQTLTSLKSLQTTCNFSIIFLTLKNVESRYQN